MIMTEKITKRDINTILSKLSKDMAFLQTTTQVDNLVTKYVPNVEQIMVECSSANGYDGYTIEYHVNLKYDGKNTISDFKRVDDDFKELLSHKYMKLCIYKQRNSFEIEFKTVFEYIDKSGEKLISDLIVKSKSILIDLNIRKKEISLLLDSMRSISSGTLANLISNENIGEASSKYSLIDEVREKFIDFTLESINIDLKVPEDWREAWDRFVSNNDIKTIAYELGFTRDEVDPFYSIKIYSNDNIDSIKQKLCVELDNTISIKVSKLSKELLKDLSLLYAFNIVLFHCKNNNLGSANKVLNKTIPRIESYEYERDFYIEFGEKGMNILKKS